MSSITDIDRAQFGAITFAEPAPEHPYADIFSAAAQNQLVAGTDNLVAEPAAREQAYDARIRAIKDQTGIELENPERGGYSIEARRAIRQAVIAGGMSPIDETGGIPAYQKRIFDQRLAEIQQKHSDLNLPTETAEGIAHAAGDTLSHAMGQPDLNPVLKYGAEFAGSLYGERRNPLFLGSLFAGPTSAVGETALARIASSALFQGLYNAGITAAAQPAVQKWQADIGRESGVVPALQDVGAAFVMGMIPGAAIEGVKELAGPLGRLLRGRPEPGDLAAAGERLGPVQPSAEAAARAGEESIAADTATLTEAAPKDVPREMHDDLIGAALKRADDPAAPSPEAVAAIEEMKNGSGGDQRPSLGAPEQDQATQAGTGRGAANQPGTGREFIDTRGSGAQFHGSSSADLEPSSDHYSTLNYYGQGFYTTDAVDIAHGYSKRGSNKTGERNLYQAQEKRPLKIVDGEAPIPEEVVAAITPKGDEYGISGILGDALSENPKNLRELYDEIRDIGTGEGYSADSIQEIFDGLNYALRGLGYDGLSHQGGLRTGKPPHRVVIYFDPEKDITVNKYKAGYETFTKRAPEPISSELQARIEQAAPQTPADAMRAADEALDDFGRRDGMAALRERMQEARAAQDEATETWRANPSREERAAGDTLSKIPMVRKDGSVAMMTERTVRSMGDIEQTAADLVRSCK